MADINVNTLRTLGTKVVSTTTVEGGNVGTYAPRPLQLKVYDAAGRTLTTDLTCGTTESVVQFASDNDSIRMSGISANPSADDDVSNKKYVDDTVFELPIKLVVRAAAVSSLYTASPYSVTGGITLTSIAHTSISTLSSIFDNITLVVGDRVLLRQESPFGQCNGIYEVISVGSSLVSWVLQRTTDMNTSVKAKRGSIVYVTDGTANALKGYMLTTANVTLGVTPLTFVQMTDSGSGGISDLVAGNGIDISGSTISTNVTGPLGYVGSVLSVNSSSKSGQPLVSAGTVSTAPTYSYQTGPTNVSSISTLTDLPGTNVVTGRATDGSLNSGGFVLRSTANAATNGSYGPAFYLGDPNADRSARIVLRGDGSSARIRVEQLISGVWTPLCELS